MNSSQEITSQSEQCNPLKNIQYQSMLINPNYNEMEQREKETITTVHTMLENEMVQTNNEKVAWSKLNKLCKINKLMDYADECKEKHELSEEETKELKTYLKTLLDRKKLLRIKEVTYDKNKGILLNIQALVIEKKDNKMRFTLKNMDKKKSSLSNLAPYTKRKTLKESKTKGKNKKLSILEEKN